MQKSSDAREGKNILTNALIELAECVFKNNIFEHFFLQRIKGDCYWNYDGPTLCCNIFYLFIYLFSSS